MDSTTFALLENEISKASAEFSNIKKAVIAYDSPDFVASSIDREWALKGMVSLSMQSVYGSLESILETILKRVDGFRAEGEDSHAQIIEAASLPIEGIRPRVISAELKALLIHLKGFRHVARKRYPEEIRVGSLLENVVRAEQAIALMSTELAEFKQAMLEPSVRASGRPGPA